ncbi:MAG: hypothetical protein CVU05_12610 [Bacteroidetes bacterium HGW-Bacteroidetes-21]|jgi:hypothetical protein|nr:MAG: hypothetical protein CVU05_12610 [Bacteroidetes bacterium HGW-Bacteroidetes-21]
MKSIVAFVFLTTLPVYAAFAQYNIDSADIKKHIYVLASDSLEGRNTGAAGQKKAAAYIADLFEEFGMKPINNLPGKEGYYQKFCIYSPGKTYAFLSPDTTLPETRRKANILLKDIVQNIEFDETAFRNNMYYFYFSARKQYGDVIKKAVFLKDNDASFSGDSTVTVVFNSSGLPQALKTIQEFYSSKHIKSFIINVPSGDYNKIVAEMPEGRFLAAKNQADVKFYLLGMLKPKKCGLPGAIYSYYSFCMQHPDCEIIVTKSATFNKIFASSFKVGASETFFRQSVYTTGMWDSIPTENVVCIAEGKSKENEVVVVGAHYDHVGRNYKGEINYGADDNASGTASVIEIARMISENRKKNILPGKSIMMVAFTGEEEGLIGSEAFLINAPMFNYSVSAMINMDMIGRSDDKHSHNETFTYGLALGSKKRKLYKKVFKASEEIHGTNIVEKPGMVNKLLYIFGSDHHAFARRNIPSFVFFTGLHDDYHTPADTPDKIRYPNNTAIARIAGRLAFMLAE